MSGFLEEFILSYWFEETLVYAFLNCFWGEDIHLYLVLMTVLYEGLGVLEKGWLFLLTELGML